MGKKALHEHKNPFDMTLPQSFTDDLASCLPADEADRFFAALTDGEQPVAVRLNLAKCAATEVTFRNADGQSIATQAVPWCPEGRYLGERPAFTLDPLLHGGAYYVQDPSCQFLTHVLRSFVEGPVTALDLCAAPGGKSTAALSSLPEGSVLVCNEIDRKRAFILAENVGKWGNPNVCVTNGAPADFGPLAAAFDLIIADVPCSGEGMFRKDPEAIGKWSPAKVRECAALQRRILDDIWPCLKPGGLLVYSTCTFNVHEDEEQLEYLCSELGATLLPIPVEADWHIHPALCGPFAPDVRAEHACRFMPHFTRGEGFFIAVVRKGESDDADADAHRSAKAGGKKKDKGSQRHSAKGSDLGREWLSWTDGSQPDALLHQRADGTVLLVPEALTDLFRRLQSAHVQLLSAGVELGVLKGKDHQPAHALALSSVLNRQVFPHADVDLDTALLYLHREAITLDPSVPLGYVLVTYRGLPLGFVKNIGRRCNSLYPAEWRIRNL